MMQECVSVLKASFCFLLFFGLVSVFGFSKKIYVPGSWVACTAASKRDLELLLRLLIISVVAAGLSMPLNTLRLHVFLSSVPTVYHTR